MSVLCLCLLHLSTNIRRYAPKDSMTYCHQAYCMMAILSMALVQLENGNEGWYSNAGRMYTISGCIEIAKRCLKCRTHLSHFLKEFFLLLVPPTGIHNNEILLLCLELFHTLLCNGGWIRLCVAAIEGYLCFCRVLLQLVKGTWRQQAASQSTSYGGLTSSRYWKSYSSLAARAIPMIHYESASDMFLGRIPRLLYLLVYLCKYAEAAKQLWLKYSSIEVIRFNMLFAG